MATESSPLTARGQQHAATAMRKRRLAIAFAAAVVVCGATVVPLLLTATTRRTNDPIDVPAATATDASAAAGSDGEDLDTFFCGLSNYETGYVALANKKDDHYFYWLIPSGSAEPSTDPLVLWLTGGPGAPSTLGPLTENGPCIVQPDLSTKINEYSWTNEANVIWLDQPTNVGFSYGAPEDADSNEDNVGENIFWFLQGFFDKHPELAGRDFYITGESYGGHYVPAAAHYVWQQNKLKTHKVINLKGIAIGNGLVDTVLQSTHYADMLNNAYNVTFANESTLTQMRTAALDCEHQRLARGAAAEDADTCYDNLLLLMDDAKRNPYDIRKRCDEEDASRCVPSDHVLAYLERPHVRERLGVSDRANRWQMVNMDVNMAFTISGDTGLSTAPLVADLLDDGMRVLVYAGDADLMCNWYGNDAWTKALEWDGKAEFNAAKERAYVTASGVDAGVVRSHDQRFTFLRLYNSGHMVPQDQPAVALDMLSKFLKNQTL